MKSIILVFLLGIVFSANAQPNPLLDLGDTYGRKLSLFNNGINNNFYGLGMSFERMDIYAGAQLLSQPQIVINNQGYLGMGTTAPAYLIDLATSLGKKLALFRDGTGNFYGFGIENNRMEIYAAAGASDQPAMVLTADNNLGIGLTNPDHRLQVRGDAKIEGEVHNIVNGSANMLSLAYGTFELDGSKLGGTNNIAVVRLDEGYYRVLVTNESLSILTCTVNVTPITIFPRLVNITEEIGNGITISTWDSSGDPIDSAFTVSIFKQ